MSVQLYLSQYLLFGDSIFNNMTSLTHIIMVYKDLFGGILTKGPPPMDSNTSFTRGLQTQCTTVSESDDHDRL